MAAAAAAAADAYSGYGNSHRKLLSARSRLKGTPQIIICQSTTGFESIHEIAFLMSIVIDFNWHGMIFPRKIKRKIYIYIFLVFFGNF
jgi:hypothetical protein